MSNAAIDSNSTSTFFAEETSLRVLPVNPTWYAAEPNTFSDFGMDIKTVTRKPINISRQQGKGTTTDIDVVAGWNQDLTQNNMTRLLQGFLFANAREKFKSAPFNGTQLAVTGTAAHFTGAAGLTVPANRILKSAGFVTPGNNGLFLAGAPAAGSIPATPYGAGAAAVVAEVSANATLECVGISLTGDVELFVPNGTTILTPYLASAATVDFTTLGLIVGEWGYLGDDNPAHAFVNGDVDNTSLYGFVRIKAIAAHRLDFDLALGSDMWTPTAGGDFIAVPGGGASFYFGTVIKNEQTVSTIIKRSYSLQRQLGIGIADTPQLEQIIGALCNKMTINVKQNDKLTVDIDFVGMDAQYTNAAELTGVYTARLNETAFNTSQDLFLQLLNIIDTTTPNPAPLFAYATDATLDINNNVTADKALGVVGSFDGTAGMMAVSGKLTCYFNDINAVQAVRNNADVGTSSIYTRKNAGFITDIPLLTLGGGKLKVEKDKKIMVDVSQDGAENQYGYTVLYNNFAYLPSSAMATQA